MGIRCSVAARSSVVAMMAALVAVVAAAPVAVVVIAHASAGTVASAAAHTAGTAAVTVPMRLWLTGCVVAGVVAAPVTWADVAVRIIMMTATMAILLAA